MSDIEGLLNTLIQPEIQFFLAVNTAGMVEVLLYGIHVVLFCVCMFILARNRRSTQWFIALSAVIMFVLSTADTAITMHLLTHDIGSVFDPEKLPGVAKRIALKNPLFVTNNFVADLVLLYRCYMVWGRSKYVLIGASFLVLADSIWGYISMGANVSFLTPTFFPVYIWSIFAINLLLAMITVGRIFWVVHKVAKPFMGKNLQSYHIAMGVVLESSAVYAGCILAYILFPTPTPYRVVMIVICMRLVAIMPTLLIVQVGLGRVLKDTNHTGTLSEIDAEGGGTSIVLDTLAFSTQHGQTTTRSIVEDRRSIDAVIRTSSRNSLGSATQKEFHLFRPSHPPAQ
ncbi:hypothetical protein CPC08DRAFT_707541 [Agrocybe pediades]|nr:hypothetical protein CPC08DRAFT_707541 [Agrocybe pediades]